MYRAWRRFFRRYRGVFHALVVAFAVQVSGAGHALTDLVSCLDHEEHDDPDCADDCDSCSPGCPDCHCSHAASPVVSEALGERFEFATTIEFAATDDERPSRSFAFGIYRPPRA